MFAGVSADGWTDAQSTTSRKYAGWIAPSLSRTPFHGSGTSLALGVAIRFGLNSVTPTASPLPAGGGVGAGDGVGEACAAGRRDAGGTSTAARDRSTGAAAISTTAARA